MPDDFYQLARQLDNLSRQERADLLRKWNQQMVDAVAERAADLAMDMGIDESHRSQFIRAVRSISLKSRIADDRMHLRRAEAVLNALRRRKAIIVSRNDVRDAYDQGHGVDILENKDSGMVEVFVQPGKFKGD